MYAIYRELHPPTGVEHCLECHFFNLQQRNLVVAATSLLRVYNLSTVCKHSSAHAPYAVCIMSGYIVREVCMCDLIMAVHASKAPIRSL